MNNGKVLSNIIWRFAERVGAQCVGFVVSIILARILLPDDYGLVALVSVFLTIMNVFVDSGFGNALIQKKEVDDLDFSSVFWFNIGTSVFLYIVVFFAASLIAEYYHRDELVILIRVLSIQIIIASIKNVEQAYVSRTLQFKRFFFATIGGTIGAAIIGIYMAKSGYGVWALVAQQLLNTLVDTIILWCTVGWRPQFAFSLERLKIMFDYGWKLLLAAILGNGYISLRQLIIGKAYSPSDLAYYNRGERFPDIFVNNIDSAIGNVLFPVMSKEQDSKDKIKYMMRRAIKTSMYVVAPLMVGLICCGDVFVKVLLTDKWMPCVRYMRVLCITFLFYPLSTGNLNAMLSLGRSDLYLTLEIMKKTIGIISLIITMRISIMAMALSVLFTAICAQIINTWPNKKLLDYSLIEQIKDLIPELMLSAVMGAVVYSVNFLKMNDVLTLLIQIGAGVVSYVIGSVFWKLESFSFLKSAVSQLLRS